MLQAKIIYLIEDQELNGKFIDYRVRCCPLDTAESVLSQLKNSGYHIISATIEEVDAPHQPVKHTAEAVDGDDSTDNDTPILNDILASVAV